MAELYKAALESVSDVYGGTDFVVRGLGSTTELDAASLAIGGGITHQSVDDGDDNAFNVDIGWHYVTPTGGDAAWQRSGLLTAKQTVQNDIYNLQSLVDTVEGTDLTALIARDKVDTHYDSGHDWLDDMLHAWVKPWLRLCYVGMAAEKANFAQRATATVGTITATAKEAGAAANDYTFQVTSTSIVADGTAVVAQIGNNVFISFNGTVTSLDVFTINDGVMADFTITGALTAGGPVNFTGGTDDGTIDPTTYADVWVATQRQALNPGLLGFWDNAVKTTWRPLRLGHTAWEYDTATGGTLADSDRAVTYPTGETVALWNAREAIRSL